MTKLNKQKLKIGILSASSQVASSVAFYFRNFTNHDITCFIRSPYSGIFFELFDIRYEYVHFSETENMKRQFSEFDIMLDFSYPSGELVEIPKLIKKNFESVFPALPVGCTFIYMSSIMAYGMPSLEKQLNNYFIPRATYGYIKRKSEKIANELGTKYGIRVLNFRLGQVHGFLQSVNVSFREKLGRVRLAYIDGNPDDLTNTIFISSLCTAISASVDKKYRPGTYTLVSNTQWSLEELYNYYINYYNLNTSLSFMPAAAKRRNTLPLMKKLIQRLKQYRPLIETYFLLNAPGLNIKIKGKYKEAEAYKQIYAAPQVAYIDFNLLGKPSLPLINGLKSSYEEVLEAEKAMEALYYDVIEKARK